MKQKNKKYKEFAVFLVFFSNTDRNKKNDSEYAIRNDFLKEAIL
jgi:hypothetical protein